MQNKWKVSEDGRAINKTFSFDAEKDAQAFMAAVAKVADEMNHHPDWRQAGRDIHVTLTTHDTGGLTRRDVQLAETMDQIADEFASSA